MPAPTGFVHAFDLTRILLYAIEQAGLSGDIHKDREGVRQALENLRGPVKGIIKTYERPFKPYRVIGSDAHEALGTADYTLACFGASGKIEQVIEQPATEPGRLDRSPD